MVDRVIQSLSPIRFETYLRAAGFDKSRAMELYIWNAKLGASFHFPIQATEVALRNRIDYALTAEFGRDWWKAAQFTEDLDRQRNSDMQMVLQRIQHKGRTADTDQIVASLSFGFWVGMLHRRYNPTIWSRHLANAFPFLPPEADRQALFDLAGKVQRLRNRISHHEPLIGTNVLEAHGELMKLLQWICPDSAAWVKPYCEAPKLVRLKP